MCYGKCPEGNEDSNGECLGPVHGIYPCNIEKMNAWEDDEIRRGEEMDERAAFEED